MRTAPHGSPNSVVSRSKPVGILITAVVACTLIALSVTVACTSSSKQEEFREAFVAVDQPLYENYVQPLQDANLTFVGSCDPVAGEEARCEDAIDLLDNVDPALLDAAEGLRNLRPKLPEDAEEDIAIIDDMIDALELMYQGDQLIIRGWREHDGDLWLKGWDMRVIAERNAADYTERLRKRAEKEEG